MPAMKFSGVALLTPPRWLKLSCMVPPNPEKLSRSVGLYWIWASPRLRVLADSSKRRLKIWSAVIPPPVF